MVYRKIDDVIQDESTEKSAKWEVVSRKINNVIKKDESTEKSGKWKVISRKIKDVIRDESTDKSGKSESTEKSSRLERCLFSLLV